MGIQTAVTWKPLHTDFCSSDTLHSADWQLPTDVSGQYMNPILSFTAENGTDRLL